MRSFFRSRFGDWQEWFSLLLLMVTLGIVMRSIEAASWLNPQPSLFLVLALSVLASLIVAKSRIRAPGGLAIGLVLGVLVTVWQVARLIPRPVPFFLELEMTAPFLLEGPLPELEEGWTYSYQQLFHLLSLARPSESSLYFAVFLAFLAWTTGYVSGWLLWRRRNPWAAVLLGTTAILVNLSYTTEEKYRFFLIFLLAATCLVVQVVLRGHIASSGRGRRSLLVRGAAYRSAVALAIASLLVSGAWFAPRIRAENVQAAIGDAIPWGKQIDSSSINIFYALDPKQSIIKNADREELNFSGSVDLSGNVQFVITSSKRYSYWRTRRYGVYGSDGWTSRPAGEISLERGALPSTVPAGKRIDLAYSIVNKAKTDVVMTAGEFASADTPVRLQTLNASESAEAGNVAAVTTARVLNYNDSYNLTSYVTQVTSAELAEAGAGYPAPIADAYLQLPGELPVRITQLARLVTSRAKTPYGKVTAVLDYLSRYAYVREGTSPPLGRDGVDDFLFVQRAGNCTNFASAAIVMLRAAGVPARLASGYLAREWTGNTATIRARDYHAWPEVYFPGYGWIEFEATQGALAWREGAGDVESAGATTGEAPLAAVLPVAPPKPVNTPSSPDMSVSGGPWWGTWAAGAAGAVLVITLTSFIMRNRKHRSVKWTYASSVYGRMCFLARLSGMAPATAQTPLEYAVALSAAFPTEAGAIRNVSWAYSLGQYARGRELTRPELVELRHSWRTVRKALVKRRLSLGWR